LGDDPPEITKLRRCQVSRLRQLAASDGYRDGVAASSYDERRVLCVWRVQRSHDLLGLPGTVVAFDLVGRTVGVEGEDRGSEVTGEVAGWIARPQLSCDLAKGASRSQSPGLVALPVRNRGGPTSAAAGYNQRRYETQCHEDSNVSHRGDPNPLSRPWRGVCPVPTLLLCAKAEVRCLRQPVLSELNATSEAPAYSSSGLPELLHPLPIGPRP
jgi:hypothetical protein